MDIIKQLSLELDISPKQVTGTLDLLKEGATIPFIARYRKEHTGNLDEICIRSIDKKYNYYLELDERRKTILESITSQGKLTAELEKNIRSAKNKTELEDLYLPYRPKKTTRASKARDAGLEPLSHWLYGLREEKADCVSYARSFINDEKGFGSPEKALQGAADILAEELSDDAEVRKWMRELTYKEGFFVSSCRKDYAEQKTKFQMYYDFKEPVNRIVSHRFLALLRGEREKVLSVKLGLPEEKILSNLESRFIRHPRSAASVILKETVKDSYHRLLLPATETEIRRDLRERAVQEAFNVFAANLRELLLAPPAGLKPVLGIDPGFRTGCKAVALDRTGKFLEHHTVYPHPPQNNEEEAKNVLLAMIENYRIELIAIGNGTAGRETDLFVRKIIKEIPESRRPICVIISEAGASVYSASKLAGEEFPEFDLTVRGAISIGRRLQDPLSELVKVDPKSIGVGQYQHDLNQISLKAALEDVVESCVNLVGADINLSSVELLKYVAGLSRQTAANLVSFRDQNGPFTSREELRKVSGIGAKSYEQAAGFLRIPGAPNPLDDSAVHPERYALVQQMASSMNTRLENFIGNAELVKTIP
ncbi:MAG: helix-hairpin-helix domain-containing protein, partial [Candidatus Aminicenantes bacterium]|nr:helix-hairpin-helix domain-containing protein [Candidatus Aminicenantes bacterium]